MMEATRIILNRLDEIDDMIWHWNRFIKREMNGFVEDFSSDYADCHKEKFFISHADLVKDAQVKRNELEAKKELLEDILREMEEADK